MRAGKAPSAAVDQGFAHAWVTIVDTHVTTIVSAAILFLFGTGPVKGFATTLTVGLLANLFTAVFVSRAVSYTHLPMEIMPATLKIKEKARKYHFNLSQSTFTPRKNSTGSLRFLGPELAPAPALNVFRCLSGSCTKKLDGHLLALPQLVQMGIENDPRDKDCREQVGQQTDGEGGCKALYRATAKDK